MSRHEVKKDEHELPSKDVVKDGALTWAPKSVEHWAEHTANAAALEWLGFHEGGNLMHDGVTSHPLSEPANADVAARRAAAENPNVMTPQPKNEAPHEMAEGFEKIAHVFDGLGIITGVDEMFNGKGVEKKIGGGVDAAAGVMGLAGGTAAEVAPWVAATKMVYDTTKAGDAALQERGVWGKNEEGKNRDAAELSAHVGHEVRDAVGSRFEFKDGKLQVVQGDDLAGEIVGNVAGAAATLGSSFVTGSMALGAGTVELGKEVGRSMSPDDIKEAMVRSKQLDAEKAHKDAAEEEEYKRKLKTLHGDDKTAPQKVHAERELIKMFGWDE